MSVINLRQFTLARNLRFADALREAEKFLEIYNRGGDCCPLRTVTYQIEKPEGRSHNSLMMLNHDISAIFYSSGFWCIFKKKDKKHYLVHIRAMTEEEKTRGHIIPAPPMYEMGEEELDGSE
jgi:hypothetical protein